MAEFTDPEELIRAIKKEIEKKVTKMNRGIGEVAKEAFMRNVRDAPHRTGLLASNFKLTTGRATPKARKRTLSHKKSGVVQRQEMRADKVIERNIAKGEKAKPYTISNPSEYMGRQQNPKWNKQGTAGFWEKNKRALEREFKRLVERLRSGR